MSASRKARPKLFVVTELNQLFGTTLFGIAPVAGTQGWMAYLLPPKATWKDPTITLTDAWSNDNFRATQGGVFVFSATTPVINNATDAQAIITVLTQYTSGQQYGYLCWLNFSSTGTNAVVATGLNFSYSSPYYTPVQNVPLSFQVSISVTLSVQTNCNIAFANDLFTITPASGGACQLLTNFGGIARTDNLTAIYLPCSGPELGTLKMDAVFTSAINNFPVQQLCISYYMGIASGEQIYPMFTVPATDTFHITIDPTSLLFVKGLPVRTYYLFAANNGYVSNWSSDTGLALTCTPFYNTAPYPNAPNLVYPLDGCGMIVMQNLHTAQDFDFTPAGNFYISPAVKPATNTFNLLCGLSGVETINVTTANGNYAGDFISFQPGNNAQANNFPAIPGVTGGELLSNTWTTSWATIIPSGTGQNTINYFSQPSGASLYALNKGVGDTKNNFLGFYEPVAANLSTGGPYYMPMAPYNGLVITDAQKQAVISSFESTILSPSRKQVADPVAQQQLTTVHNASGNKGDSEVADSNGTVSTSPQGLLVSVNASWGWDSLILAQNELYNGSSYSLNFTKLNPLLQSAFQTNQQFLVISQNTQNLPVQGQNILGQFSNEMSLDGWPFILNVPTADTNGNYNNVIIFKFCEGSLIDRVTKTDSWTASDNFNVTDNEGIASLSSWLQAYIQEGIDNFKVNNDPNFQYFATIAADPSWQGIIALKTDISLQDFPPDLQGLLGGIDMSLFYGHHFGINVNFVQQQGSTLVMNPVSSMFGLIDYTDPLFLSCGQNLDAYRAIAPNNGANYNFIVLTLKVLFENSKIQNFQSYVQLTVNQLFGDAVVPVDNNNIIIFTGSYENHNGIPTYVFNETGDNLLALDSNVWNGVEIIKASFSTISGGTSTSSIINSRFLFWGFLNFQQLKGLDMLSFGSDEGQFNSGDGLGFANLAIDMSFHLDTPSVKTFSFDLSHIAFNASQSSTQPTRASSLYAHFPLQVTGITQGTSDSLPVSQGYVNVTVPDLANNYSTPQADWFGLVFNLNMGTLGALASAAGLNTTFVAYWGTKSSGVGAGIKLPGVTPQAKMLSLQGVLNMNIGSIQLLSADTQEGAPAYMMMLNSIAIKFLGLKFPPGNINFYLFGDPDADAQPGSLGWYIAYQKTA